MKTVKITGRVNQDDFLQAFERGKRTPLQKCGRFTTLSEFENDETCQGAYFQCFEGETAVSALMGDLFYLDEEGLEFDTNVLKVRFKTSFSVGVDSFNENGEVLIATLYSTLR